MSEHTHDWRVDPQVVLSSNPPQAQLVCAICGAHKGSGFAAAAPVITTPSRDPSTWDKWQA